MNLLCKVTDWGHGSDCFTISHSSLAPSRSRESSSSFKPFGFAPLVSTNCDFHLRNRFWNLWSSVHFGVENCYFYFVARQDHSSSRSTLLNFVWKCDRTGCFGYFGLSYCHFTWYSLGKQISAWPFDLHFIQHSWSEICKSDWLHSLNHFEDSEPQFTAAANFWHVLHYY